MTGNVKRLAAAGLSAGACASALNMGTLATPAVAAAQANWTGSVSPDPAFYGGATAEGSGRPAYHTYKDCPYQNGDNPVDSTLVAVTCGDGTVWLGSLQNVPANDDSIRTVIAAMSPGTCWKVRVRNSQNSGSYTFSGFQFQASL